MRLPYNGNYGTTQKFNDACCRGAYAKFGMIGHNGMATEKEIKNWLDKHQKQDTESFAAIHTHLDRLDKATNNDLIIYKLDEMKRDISDLKREMKENNNELVTKTEFNPVRNIVYGMVGLILIGVLSAIIALVVIR